MGKIFIPKKQRGDGDRCIMGGTSLIFRERQGEKTKQQVGWGGPLAFENTKRESGLGGEQRKGKNFGGEGKRKAHL